MAWIQQVPDDEATGPLGKIYAGGKQRAGGVANIIRVMSQRPRALGYMMQFYTAEMHGKDSGLTRPEREMLATITSWANECFY